MRSVVVFSVLAAVAAVQLADAERALSAETAACCKEAVCCKEPCAKESAWPKQQTEECLLERLAGLERCGLKPYRIGPTDVLKVDARMTLFDPKSERKRTVQIAGEQRVGPDGKIELGPLLSVDVNGMTAEEAEAAIQAVWTTEKPAASVEAKVDVVRRNSKFAYLVTENTPSGDYVMRVHCTPESTVASVFQGAVWPQPIDFSAAEISLHRPPCNVSGDCGDKVICDEVVRQIVWDVQAGQPTAGTDYSLLPSDRLFVKLPAPPGAPPLPEPLVAAAPYCSPIPPSPAPPAKSQVMFNIELVTDPEHSLDEFPELREGMHFITADSETILPALRILKRHGLVRTISSPKIATLVNRPARLVIGGKTGDGDDSWEGVKVDLRALESGEKLTVTVTVELTHERSKHGLSTSVAVGDGETVIMRTRPSRDDAPTDDDDPPVYVVITPTLVK